MYTKPEMHVEQFEVEDILTASGTGSDTPSDPPSDPVLNLDNFEMNLVPII